MSEGSGENRSYSLQAEDDVSLLRRSSGDPGNHESTIHRSLPSVIPPSGFTGSTKQKSVIESNESESDRSNVFLPTVPIIQFLLTGTDPQLFQFLPLSTTAHRNP